MTNTSGAGGGGAVAGGGSNEHFRREFIKMACEGCVIAIVGVIYYILGMNYENFASGPFVAALLGSLLFFGFAYYTIDFQNSRAIFRAAKGWKKWKHKKPMAAKVNKKN